MQSVIRRKLNAAIVNPLLTLPQMGRNVAVLALCQAIGFSGVPMALMVGGIVGADLAPSPALETLPVAFMVIGTAIFTMPAALLMRRIGRKRGFIIAAIVASAAALGAAVAISTQSFFVFCSALFFLGGSQAFVLQYRFAAAESVEPRHAGKAISFVFVGGILAAFLGPELGRSARDWLGHGAYSGSFAAMSILYASSAILLLLMRDIVVNEDTGHAPERPLRRIVAQPRYMVAALCGTVAFGVMGVIMSATPISMHVMDRFSLGNTTTVIQSHVVAMYVPSLFTGFLVDRLGLKVLQVLGVIGLGAGVGIAASGHNFANYLVALISLGIGWNFLFVSGTVMLIQSYRPRERFKAQGVNDFTVFAIQALAILLAGSVLSGANWELLNLLVLPFLLLTVILVIATRSQIPGREPG